MMNNLVKQRLFWPVLSIAALLVTDLFVSNGFFKIEMRDGHLYGSLIDILALRRAADARGARHDARDRDGRASISRSARWRRSPEPWRA